MKSGKGHQEEYDDEEEEFGTKKEATPSANNTKDGKKGGKSSATRSKHSVTEQRRRSKINERFQILRELIPNSDQKRDTASFLFEVIHYVQFLQEKVTKYEGSYQPWSSEPTKMTPWRNSNWRNLAGQPQTTKNVPGLAFPIRFDESSAAIPVTMPQVPHNPIEPDHARDTSCRPIDLQTELPNKTMDIQDGAFSHALRGPPPLDAQSTACPNAMNLQDELTIESGTISIESVYSKGLLNSLTQALESTGVDLSQANVSVQINLGKRAHSGSIAKDHGVHPMPSGNQPVRTFQDAGRSEDLDQSLKRQKL